MNSEEKITGKGLLYPFVLDNGALKTFYGIELIRSCIHNILAFEYGERYFQRDFGVALQSLLSEPNDLYVEAILDYRLKTQLPMWDKRIIVDDVTIQRESYHKLNVRVNVSYTNIEATNLPTELIYPLNN